MLAELTVAENRFKVKDLTKLSSFGFGFFFILVLHWKSLELKHNDMPIGDPMLFMWLGYITIDISFDLGM